MLRAYRRQNRGQNSRYEFGERISRKDLNLAILAYNLEEAKRYRNSEIKKLLSLGAKSYGAEIKRTHESKLEIENEIVLDNNKNEVEFNVNKDNQKENIDERAKDYERDAGDLGTGGFRKNELRGVIIDRIVSKQSDIRTLVSNLERKREYRVSKQSDLVVKRGNIEKLSDSINANEKVIESTSGFRKLVKGFGRNVKELCGAFMEFTRKFGKVVGDIARFIKEQRAESKIEEKIYEDEIINKNPKNKSAVSGKDKKNVGSIDDLFGR